MNLTRYELIHATDKQFHSVGLERKNNKDWMERAMQREFTPAEMEMFHKSKVLPVKQEKDQREILLREGYALIGQLRSVLERLAKG